MNKKLIITAGIVGALVLILIVVLFATRGLGLFKKEIKSVNPYAQETNNFPVYPNSVFVKKEDLGNKTSYLWSSGDNFDQVVDYFKTDKDKSGWSCAGGTGSYVDKRNANFKTSCSAGQNVYDLYLLATEQKTDIRLEVANKKPEQPQVKQVNTKTYTNNSYNFTFSYPADFLEFDEADALLGQGIETGFTYDENNKLLVFVDKNPFKEYEYMDPVYGSVFAYNIEGKKWINTTGPDNAGIDVEDLSPKKLDSNLEAYRAKASNDLCFVETMIIPNPTFDLVVELINFSCDEEFSGFKLDLGKVLDSFEFVENEQGQNRQYVNTKYGYILTYPRNIPLIGNKNSDTVALNDHLKVKGGTGKNEILECVENVKAKKIVNGCPRIESQEIVNISGVEYTKVSGAIGFPAVSFITYIYKSSAYYLEFEVTAPQNNDGRSLGISSKIAPVPDDQKRLLESILQSLKFL